MNQVKIVQGNQSHSLQMKKLNTKFEYLSSSRYQDQKYLQYLQSLQKLNKQLISKLRNKDWQSHLQSLITNIQMQNNYSNKALSQHRSLTKKLQKQSIQKTQSKHQIQQFYKKRIDQLNFRIEQLRQLMTDKQISFSKVLNRLRMYEELNEPKLQEKLDDFDFVINDGFVKKIISKISTDKHKLALDLRTNKKQLNQYKSECVKLKTALGQKINYVRYKQEIINNSQLFQKSLESTGEEIEGNNERDTVRVSPDPATNARNLVNLIKKQKMVNDSLERQFKQVIELNEDVINYNQLLTKSNTQKQDELKRIKAKIDIMQKQMKKHENHFGKNLRKCKSIPKLNYKYLDLIEDRPLRTYLECLKQEIGIIDIDDAIKQKHDQLRAYSVADVYAFQKQQYQDYFGEVEQF